MKVDKIVNLKSSHYKKKIHNSIGRWASLVTQMVKNFLAILETQVQSLGQEDPLEEGMATHSSILAWRIPWTEGPDHKLCGHKESDTTERLALSFFFLFHIWWCTLTRLTAVIISQYIKILNPQVFYWN